MTALATLTFLAKGWLWLLLIPAGLTVLAYTRYRRHRNSWKGLVSPRLAPTLVDRSRPIWQLISTYCILGSLALLIFALGRPIAGYDHIETTARGRNIIFVMDSSRSMRVRDVAPSRFEVARTLAFELMPELTGDKISIVAFANEAFTLAPLTTDHNIIRQQLTQMSHESIPEGGSDLPGAVDHALEMLKRTGEISGAIILMSDGEDHDKSIADVGRKARALSIPIITIGIGTDDGDIIPDPRRDNNTFLDDRGNPVVSRLRTASLQSLATATNGDYIDGRRMGNARQRIARALAALEAIELESRVARVPQERFHYFLIPAALLMIASVLLRTPWSSLRGRFQKASGTSSLALAALLLCLSPSATRADEESIALDAISQKIDTLESERTEEKLTSAWLELGHRWTGDLASDALPGLYFEKGSLEFDEGDYAAAAESFSQSLLTNNSALRTEAHYNLGTTLARLAEKDAREFLDLEELPETLPQQLVATINEAIGHFESTLENAPDHPSAQANIDALKKALEDLKSRLPEKPEEEQNQNEQNGDESQDSEKQEGEDNSEPSEGEGDESDSDANEEKQDQEGEEQKEGQEDEQSNSSEEQGEQADEEADSESGEKESPSDKGQESEEEGSSPEPTAEDQEQEAEGKPTGQQPIQQAQLDENSLSEFAQLLRQGDITEEEQIEALQALREAADSAAQPRKRPTRRPKRKQNW